MIQELYRYGTVIYVVHIAFRDRQTELICSVIPTLSKFFLKQNCKNFVHTYWKINFNLRPLD